MRNAGTRRTWDEQEFDGGAVGGGGAGGGGWGLTQECSVHNPLIQICKKIAF